MPFSSDLCALLLVSPTLLFFSMKPDVAPEAFCAPPIIRRVWCYHTYGGCCSPTEVETVVRTWNETVVAWSRDYSPPTPTDFDAIHGILRLGTNAHPTSLAPWDELCGASAASNSTLLHTLMHTRSSFSSGTVRPPLIRPRAPRAA
ncbi:hypothetical protein K438DRAFT_2025148, partial [Mycena galopus ATCC 62051]